MSVSPLMHELATAAANVHSKQLDRLDALGISRTALFDFEQGRLAGFVGVSQIETAGSFYTPGTEGRSALIIPANRYADGIDDLIATFPGEPEKFWTRYGLARFLNHAAVDRAVACDEPLTLRASPLAWLQADCHGTVILDWDVSFHGLLPEKILAPDADLAARLRSKLRRRPHEVRVIEDLKYAA